VGEEGQDWWNCVLEAGDEGLGVRAIAGVRILFRLIALLSCMLRFVHPLFASFFFLFRLCSLYLSFWLGFFFFLLWVNYFTVFSTYAVLVLRTFHGSAAAG